MTVPPALLSHESTEHYTPQYILDAVIACLGAIDLDSGPTFSPALFYVGDKLERFERAFAGIGAEWVVPKIEY